MSTAIIGVGVFLGVVAANCFFATIRAGQVDRSCEHCSLWNQGCTATCRTDESPCGYFRKRA